MKLIFHLFGKATSLACESPIISDSNLMGYNLEEFKERLEMKADEPFIEEIVESGLVESTSFLPTFLCPKII